ncbi:MAG: DUF4288 domain-containing protein [Pseudolysinimonas sp.]
MKTWFSAMLVFRITVSGNIEAQRARSLILFSSASFDDAFESALELGRGAEQTYLNGSREQVQWRLEKVETLDQLDAEIAEGREVYSEPMPFFQLDEGDLELWPERHVPTQTGV